MNQNATLKEALNRQFVAMVANSPLECGFAGREEIEQETIVDASISETPFERVYPIYKCNFPVSVEN